MAIIVVALSAPAAEPQGKNGESFPPSNVRITYI
jgi:hypothetical protein